MRSGYRGKLCRAARFGIFASTWFLALALPVLAQAQTPYRTSRVSLLAGSSNATPSAVVQASAEEVTTVEDPQTKDNGDDGGRYGPLEVVGLSIFGKANCQSFTPLYISNFLEGWMDPWVPAPTGSGGAARGTWVNAPNGFLSREIDPAYTHIDAAHHNRDANIGSVTSFTPLNRRMEIGVEVPYVVSLQANQDHPSATGVGDFTVIPRLMLHEDQDLGIATGLAVRIPFGRLKTGNNISSLTPFVALWADLGEGWQFRGGTSIEVPTNNTLVPDAIWLSTFALGKTLTCKDLRLIGELTPYLAMNFRQDLGTENHSRILVTSGIRTYIAWNTYFVGAFEVPLTGPLPFTDRFTFLVSKEW
jgi:hypothetical protein